MRKVIIGLIGAALLAVLAVPAISTGDASARGWHGHGGWRGGGWRGGYGWRGYGYGYYPYYAGYPYGYGCWRSVRAWSPYGYVWRRVWVCG